MVRALEELRSFFVHLRWHYQLFILPAGYLLGGLFVEHLNWRSFAAQFFNVHLLLNGGVTAYNSYWDRDEGPVGGLEHPPKMSRWMHGAALAVQGAGLLFAAPEGAVFVAIYVLTMILSVLYSAPPARWKGHPLKSLIAVGVGTGTNTFLLGYLAAGGTGLSVFVVIAAAGVALMLLSLYPVSQLFQVEADRKRGDRTFAVAFGLGGVKRFFAAGYALGGMIVTFTLERAHRDFGLAFLLAGAIGGLVIGSRLKKLRGTEDEYRPVMRLKYFASLSFSMFIAVCLWLAHR